MYIYVYLSFFIHECVCEKHHVWSIIPCGIVRILLEAHDPENGPTVSWDDPIENTRNDVELCRCVGPCMVCSFPYIGAIFSRGARGWYFIVVMQH